MVVWLKFYQERWLDRLIIANDDPQGIKSVCEDIIADDTGGIPNILLRSYYGCVMTRTEYKQAIKEYREIMVLFASIEGMPDNISYICADEDGGVWGYVNKPKLNKRFGYWFIHMLYEGVFIGKLRIPPNWKDTLVKL